MLNEGAPASRIVGPGSPSILMMELQTSVRIAVEPSRHCARDPRPVERTELQLEAGQQRLPARESLNPSLPGTLTSIRVP